MKKKVSVLGLGYIGLPTALLLAKGGNQVFGYDVDERKIGILKKGLLPFEEKGLKELFSQVKRIGTFFVTDTLQSADFYIIAVPTPQIHHEADLKYVFSALAKVKKIFKNDQTIVIESTVGPEDCQRKIIPYIKKFTQKFYFASCPERAIPGNTLYEMIHNARIIGGIDKEDCAKVKRLYSTFVKGEIFTTTPTIASTCKVMENSFRDVNIALANEFAQIAEDLGFNVWEAIELANKHLRVKILQPGPGVGGHCIPIDPWFLVAASKNNDLLTISRNINDYMPSHVLKAVKGLIQKNGLKSPKIGILGYAYKKNVDDARETPAKEVIRLLKRKFRVLVNDPYVSSVPQQNTGLHKLLTTVDIVVLLTNHDVYRQISFKKYPNILLVYDSHNLFKKGNFRGSQAQHIVLGVGE